MFIIINLKEFSKRNQIIQNPLNYFSYLLIKMQNFPNTRDFKLFHN